jgi:PKD repeat protein
MRDKVFYAIRNSRKAVVFVGALLLLLIASPIYAQALTATATATPTSGPAPLAVVFTSTVSGGTGPYTYLWNFGETPPVTDTNAAPSYTYNLAGTYHVTLTVTDSVAATITINVATIRVLLAVTATADPQCGTAPLNVCFTGLAEGGTEPYSYLWNFGDGVPANNTHEQNPCHGYMNVGNYNVTLTATDSLGNTGQMALTVYVYNDEIPFTVGISADAVLGLAPMRVNFFGTVHGPAGFIYTYSWDFGDGGTCEGDKSPQHIYAAPGTYTVTLSVLGEDPLGVCISSWMNSATIDILVAVDPSIFITSPGSGSAFTGSPICVQSKPLTAGTVLRVDYFMDGEYVGSSSTGPDYRICLDSCGANGTYDVTAMVYVGNGTSAESASVTITVSNPTLDGTHFVMKNPYRVKFYGTGFKMGAKLYINGVQAPVTKVLNSTTVIAKGGRALKGMTPEGVPVLVTIENADGGCANTVTFQR